MTKPKIPEDLRQGELLAAPDGQPSPTPHINPGPSTNRLAVAVKTFYSELEEARPLTITEKIQRTICLETAKSIGLELGRKKLSVAVKDGLALINEIISSVELSTAGLDLEMDAWEKAMNDLTSEALKAPEATNA